MPTLHRRGTLALTHSSRKTNLSRSSIQFLTERFGRAGRLDHPPPFDSLTPPPFLYSGAVSFYAVLGGDDGRLECRWLGKVKRREKIQQAVFLGERDLLLGFEQSVERWRLPAPIESLERLNLAECRLEMRLEHPLLAGLHTVEPLSEARALLSCAASDALLELDPYEGAIARVLEMPDDLYGRVYRLDETTDLRRHYIHDGLQRTHVNAASIDRTGRRAVVSTLIQGAIGVFDLVSGEYREIATGFVGCHGARFSAEGAIYFTDSATGSLVFLDGDGRIARRFGIDSRWLHDVQQIAGGVYAFALADHNELRVYDIDRDRLLVRRRFLVWPFDGLYPWAHRWPLWLGNSTQSLSYRPAP